MQGGEGEAAAEGAPKGKKRGRKLGGKNAGPELRDGGAPPASTSEAVGRMLAQKKLSSKLNHAVLERLFDDKPQNADGYVSGCLCNGNCTYNQMHTHLHFEVSHQRGVPGRNG